MITANETQIPPVVIDYGNQIKSKTARETFAFNVMQRFLMILSELSIISLNYSPFTRRNVFKCVGNIFAFPSALSEFQAGDSPRQLITALPRQLG